MLNNIGVAYTKMKDYNNALATFKQIIELEKNAPGKIYIGIASGNYGNVLRLQGHYLQALPYLYTDVAINEKQVPDNSAITCLYIANCLLHLDSVAKAGYYIDHSLLLHPDWRWSSYRVNYYENKALYYQKSGDYRTASIYQDTLLQLKDSLKNVFDNRILMATTLKVKEEKYLADKKKANWRRKM